MNTCPDTLAVDRPAVDEAELLQRFCDCPAKGLPMDQHAPDGCHGVEVVAAARKAATR